MTHFAKISAAILMTISGMSMLACQSDDNGASSPTNGHPRATGDRRYGGTGQSTNDTGNRGNRAGPGYTGSNSGTGSTGSMNNAPEPGYRTDTTPGSSDWRGRTDTNGNRSGITGSGVTGTETSSTGSGTTGR